MKFKTKNMVVTNSFPIRLIYFVTRKIRYPVIGKIKKNKIKTRKKNCNTRVKLKPLFLRDNRTGKVWNNVEVEGLSIAHDWSTCIEILRGSNRLSFAAHLCRVSTVHDVRWTITGARANTTNQEQNGIGNR